MNAHCHYSDEAKGGPPYPGRVRARLEKNGQIIGWAGTALVLDQTP